MIVWAQKEKNPHISPPYQRGFTRGNKSRRGAPPRATMRSEPKKNITISPFLQKRPPFSGLKGITAPSIERQKYIFGPRAPSFSAPFGCAARAGNALLTRLTRTWPEPFIPARRFPSCRTIKSCSLPFTQL